MTSVAPAAHFHGDDVPPSPPETALFHVIPVPYEKSVSYGTGTAGGPQAILDASCQLELFDGMGVPADFGVHTQPPVDCGGSHQEALARVEAAVAVCLDHGKIPVVLGGEHTLTSGVIRALRQQHASFGVVQFDAHADLRDTYEGSPFSHACVMRRILEHGLPLFQLGTRSYCLEEHLLRRERAIGHVDAKDLCRTDPAAFRLPADFPDTIYITFDVDGLDPSVIPATGTPVPGGLDWYRTLGLLETIIADRICIGFDVVELAPLPYQHAASFAAAQLVYAIMGFLVRSPKNRLFWNLDRISSRT